MAKRWDFVSAVTRQRRLKLAYKFTFTIVREEVIQMTETNYEAPAILDMADDNEFAVAPGNDKPSDLRDYYES